MVSNVEKGERIIMIFKTLFHRHAAYKRVNCKNKKYKALRQVEQMIGIVLDMKYYHEDEPEIYWKAQGMLEALEDVYKILKETL